ncbi:MAG: hypothetical protein A3F26_00980 [Candidatus Ryanbacteria bacterium RIFCSPHIGHO2_12_FULL_47_12b]|uniref:Transposase IS200-like domain-containing protein n=1 Tax=Candidatus Ryanbacteria bacterium RIFCSPLOWO2_02_FULL_47_14 TaxID=1802129 RepID=A0A1G2H3J0_9BACT|nr:MAG: Transposase [Parcubacteria group bacterium GW2011_GWA2_47_10b]KKU85432.1 MAG: Transposase [Parcubacteria group bacterium GW2011_GWA1_47_9]OGZ48605.1 MAG: hypothetical protein A3C83_00790 [Candidatus Ryanbacteria bacterium RIFCSPHIGHO2_02_FULL_47_25]OGZ52532.1 MAG: hypothetical protein A3F26_00980 [Candidatus Ryanbacteria bacterium RIFCSPHIGHO2_12_FULL_47_12b]OGZ56548.1 MAG: hypothetical protein A3J04_03935 [Candidatus Ryanbacteria bacterium RIFCSPLOWO2_02_FULL_47_14]
MRAHPFVNGEFYHIFNRGVEKRKIFLEKADFERFLRGIEVFNARDPIGSIHEYSFRTKLGNPVAKSRLVNVVCYCLNPNHYHIVLEQVVDGGISTYMHRLSTGFTQYFNHKYKRSGVLFQGKFKSVPIVSNNQLLHVSAYVNLNDRVHGLHPNISISSWNEYRNDIRGGLCKKDIIIKQFKNISEYISFAGGSLVDVRARKEELKELTGLLME